MYFCYPPTITEQHIKKTNHSNHEIVLTNKALVLWPKTITINNCSPDKIDNLKNFIQTKSVIIVDKVKNSCEVVSVGGHVNRSGTSFLVGNTPHNDKKQFPDLSNIYTKTNTKQTTVHTIGEKRFSSKIKLSSNIVWSESIGLVSSVFSYLGFEVVGVGVPKQNVDAVSAEQILK